MNSEDDRDQVNLDLLFSRWKGISDSSAQFATYANLILARILGAIRARTTWSGPKLQENLLKLGADSGLGFSLLADRVGEETVSAIGPCDAPSTAYQSK